MTRPRRTAQSWSPTRTRRWPQRLQMDRGSGLGDELGALASCEGSLPSNARHSCASQDQRGRCRHTLVASSRCPSLKRAHQPRAGGAHRLARGPPLSDYLQPPLAPGGGRRTARTLEPAPVRSGRRHERPGSARCASCAAAAVPRPPPCDRTWRRVAVGGPIAKGGAATRRGVRGACSDSSSQALVAQLATRECSGAGSRERRSSSRGARKRQTRSQRSTGHEALAAPSHRGERARSLPATRTRPKRPRLQPTRRYTTAGSGLPTARARALPTPLTGSPARAGGRWGTASAWP